MSLKNMAVKMALAFAAAKGVQAFSSAGGMEGVKRKLREQQRAGHSGKGSGGLGGLLGGSGSGSGGIGDLLGQLGMGGSAGSQTRGGSGLGGLLGGLAGATGGAAGATRMEGLLDRTRSTPENSPEEEEVSGQMIRAMIFAARCDGEIDETERATLMEIIGESDPEDTAFIQAQMSAKVDAEALARDTPPGHEVEVYTASILAIDPDNRAEAEYLDRLARNLKLDKRTVNEIHAAHGKTPLYSE